MSEKRGLIQTVLGSIRPEELGVTLAHEHLLLDIQPPEKRDEPGFPITLENVGYIRRHWDRNRDNRRLKSEADAIEEMRGFKAAGGSAVVEVSSIGLDRDPEGLRRISEASGVHVIMGASYYVHNYHPPEVEDLSEDALTECIVAELTHGVGETGIVPGIIGEVGLAWPVHPREARVLRASARAQRATGAALMIHPGRDAAAPLDAVQRATAAGGDPERTIVAHVDGRVFDRDAMQALAATGCYVEFDLFGQESSYYPLAPIDMPNDATRVDHLRALMDAGYAERLLVAQDICKKHSLKRYGGEGYSHILDNVVPLMQRKGWSEAEINTVLVDNPARVLTLI